MIQIFLRTPLSFVPTHSHLTFSHVGRINWTNQTQTPSMTLRPTLKTDNLA